MWNFPRLPLVGNLDLTYRCNLNCRHCWLRISPDTRQREEELSFEELKGSMDEARKMGCQQWRVSGGEPMLRPDFAEIIQYITKNVVSCALNTNGTLITPKIAGLLRKNLKKKGRIMVSLYGATAEVNDHITRIEGSFEATMRGFAYLKEAGLEVTVQLVPMRGNYHQYKEMVSLAELLSPPSRIGAYWLNLSACGDPAKNREIKSQRLSPEDIVALNPPNLCDEEWMEEENLCYQPSIKEGYQFLASCNGGKESFHIDPYGQLSSCYYVKDPNLKYDLRKGNFKEGWEEFIPSLPSRIKVEKEYFENCGSCEIRRDCRWCPILAYLEHGSYSTKIDYLCSVGKENRKYTENLKKNHRRHYEIAGITIQVNSDLPITDATFQDKFKPFEVKDRGEDTIILRHYFSLPSLNGNKFEEEVYRKPPWAIYRKGSSWIYLGISPAMGEEEIYQVAVFNHDHTRAAIHNRTEETFRRGGLPSLTLFPTDQILLSRVLADREGCFLHAAGVILGGDGILLVGHSGAGKSTLVKKLKGQAEILCDDRMIVRRWPEGFRIHGTWSHGELADVSAGSAPLKALLFLEKADENRLLPVEDKKEKIAGLLACLIKPLVTNHWWEKTLALIERMSIEVPCYRLQSSMTGHVSDLLKGIIGNVAWR